LPFRNAAPSETVKISSATIREEPMSYKLQEAEAEVRKKNQYVNAAGNAECVEFVRQATGAPHTTLWKQGEFVLDAPRGGIPRGTAIATFDSKGKYPVDGKGKHAAIYLSHTANSICVLDQWKAQGFVKERTIRAKASDHPRSDCAQCFYVIE
jgi:phage-related tail fiber protein